MALKGDKATELAKESVKTFQIVYDQFVKNAGTRMKDVLAWLELEFATKYRQGFIDAHKRETPTPEPPAT